MKNFFLFLAVFAFSALVRPETCKAQFVFSGGTVQSASVCENSGTTDISQLFSVSDTSATDTLTWWVAAPPPNGVLSASYMAMAADDTVAAMGITYTPAPGYLGPDSFTVAVTNGASGDTAYTKIYMTVNMLPTPYGFTGGTAYCAGGSGITIGLSASDTTIMYDLIPPTGTPDTVAGNEAPISFGAYTAAGVYTVVATSSAGCSVTETETISTNPLPSVYTLTGGGSYCAGATMTFDFSLDSSDGSISYNLMAGGSVVAGPIAGGSLPLDFGMYSVPDTYYVTATNTGTGCTDTMSGRPAITANPLPVVYSVTGGGPYCSGGAGAAVGLSGSQTGVKYQLYHNSLPVGVTAGTGGLATFGMFTDSGLYTAVGTDTTTANMCMSNMSGSAHIAVNPLPQVYSVTGGGSYCASATGVHVGLSGSQPGINYILYLGMAPVDTLPGTGAALDFGLITTEGSYSIAAMNPGTMCTNNMTGSAAVIINPLPSLFSVTGGGSYCAGGYGVDISLGASQTGKLYQLYDHGTAEGTPQYGSGSSVDFGMQTDSGTYTVVAVDTATLCIATMTGAPVVTVNPLPATYTMTGGGGYCASGSGKLVGLDMSDSTIEYQLYRNGAMTGSPERGTGGELYFGLFTAPGTYTAIAINTVTACSSEMSSSSVVTVIPAPASYTVSGGGSYCAGGAGVSIILSGSSMGVRYQAYAGSFPTGAAMPGTGSALSFGPDTTAGVYTIAAVDTTTTCSATMADSAIVTINPVVDPAVTIAMSTQDTVCAGTMVTFTATPSHGGATPVFHWAVNGLGAGTDSMSYSFIPTNGNRISVELNSVADCIAYDTATDTVSIMVWPNGRPSVTISVDNNTVCAGTAVTFTAVDSLGGPAPTYQWVTNGLNSGTGTAYTYTPSNGDIVYCTLTSDYLCRPANRVNSNNISITVDSPIAPSVAITASAGSYIAKGQADTFTAIVTNGGTAPLYQWFVGTTMIAGATNATYVASHLATPSDSVTCWVTRNDACALSAFNGLIITVNALGVPQIAGSLALDMYPNPNRGQFTISGNTGLQGNENITAEVTNMLGQTVYRGVIAAHDGAVNQPVTLDPQLADGVYQLNLHSAAGNSVIRFVISR